MRRSPGVHLGSIAVAKPGFTVPADAAPVVAAAIAGGTVLVLFAMLLAYRARRARVRKPVRRSFDAGRRMAATRLVRTTEAALSALAEMPLGEVTGRRAVQHGFAITVRRKRSQSCAQAAGFLSGLFEAAWALDVSVAHETCAGAAGGTCEYTITRGGPRAAAAATPGSTPAPRRSARARRDGA